jgi:hypothetical protein
MKDPVFVPGDEVYHCVRGKGIIHRARQADSPINACYIVQFATGASCVLESTYLDERELSFDPWAPPVHARPVKQGWWVGQYEEKIGLSLVLVKNQMYMEECGTWAPLHDSPRVKLLRWVCEEDDILKQVR